MKTPSGHPPFVPNPSKAPIATCRTPGCLAYTPVRSVAGTWEMPATWTHDVEKGPLCPQHSMNGKSTMLEVQVRPSSRGQFNTTGDTCKSCGSINLVPAGRCFRCMDCGENTGCG